MKYGIISDIHSDLKSLNKVLTFLKAREVNQILCCGDIIGYGPDFKEVVQTVIKNKIKSVCGNHEKGMLNQEDYKKLNDRAKIAIYIAQQMLPAELREYISSLPDFIIENQFRVVHGAPPESVFTYIDELSKEDVKRLFNLYSEPITFCGHTHVPRIIKYGWRGISVIENVEFNKSYFVGSWKRCIINVGSISEPRNTEKSVSRFVIYDNIENSVTFYEI